MPVECAPADGRAGGNGEQRGDGRVQVLPFPRGKERPAAVLPDEAVSEAVKDALDASEPRPKPDLEVLKGRSSGAKRNQCLSCQRRIAPRTLTALCGLGAGVPRRLGSMFS